MENRGFHKILKSGCRAEDARLRTAERLARLIAVLCILSWRVFWMTMMNRAAPDAGPSVAFTELEIRLLDHLVPDKHSNPSPRRTLSHYLLKVARLGGYLARASDPPPGNTVLWRGLLRLTGPLGNAEGGTSPWGAPREQRLWVIESFPGRLRKESRSGSSSAFNAASCIRPRIAKCAIMSP